MIAPFGFSMTNRRLGKLLQRECDFVEGEPGFWQCSLDGRPLLVITDESHNRMRMMTPIVDEDQVSNEELRTLLEANFDRALDAKFAIAQGQLWSVFVHPLAELADSLAVDALHQVTTLADNYGTSYTSSNLTFGGGD